MTLMISFKLSDLVTTLESYTKIEKRERERDVDVFVYLSGLYMN